MSASPSWAVGDSSLPAAPHPAPASLSAWPPSHVKTAGTPKLSPLPTNKNQTKQTSRAQHPEALSAERFVCECVCLQSHIISYHFPRAGTSNSFNKYRRSTGETRCPSRCLGDRVGTARGKIPAHELLVEGEAVDRSTHT